MFRLLWPKHVGVTLYMNQCSKLEINSHVYVYCAEDM